MFNVRYNNLTLIPSNAAINELLKHGLMLSDCKEILEHGYSAPRKRKRGIEEKWLDKGNKTYNVVIARSFNFWYNEHVWLIIHVGRFSRK